MYNCSFKKWSLIILFGVSNFSPFISTVIIDIVFQSTSCYFFSIWSIYLFLFLSFNIFFFLITWISLVLHFIFSIGVMLNHLVLWYTTCYVLFSVFWTSCNLVLIVFMPFFKFRMSSLGKPNPQLSQSMSEYWNMLFHLTLLYGFCFSYYCVMSYMFTVVLLSPCLIIQSYL